TNKQYATLTIVRCLVLSPGGGNATTLQCRRRTSKSATSKDSSAQEPRSAKGCAPSQFIRCERRNKGRTAYERTERGARAADGNVRGAATHQSVQVRTAVDSAELCGHRVAALSRGRVCNLPIGRRSLPLCGRLQPRSGVSRT